MDLSNTFQAFTPQLILILFALLMPLFDYLLKDKRLLSLIALAPLVEIMVTLIAWLFLEVWTPKSQIDLLEFDTFSGLFMMVFIAVGIVVVLGSPEFIRSDRNQGEYYSLILLAITGMTLVAQATDLIVLFVGLEIAGISSFALSGFRKSEKRSAEAATKYFIVGAFSSAMTLFAISLLYGAVGTTSISGIGEAIWSGSSWIEESQPVILLGTVLLVAGLGFKIAA